MLRYLVTLSFLAWLLISAATCQAQVVQSFDNPSRTRVYQITVSPASPQSPVLRHRLLPPRSELVKGNAATLYFRAIASFNQTMETTGGRRQFWERFEDWSELPLDELPLDEMEKELAQYDQVLQEVHFAARRTFCDWGLSVREKSPDLFGHFQPAIQGMRMLGNMLSWRVRLRVAQGRLEEAITDLQTTMAMARHVSDSHLMISGLVGIGMTVPSTMHLYEAIAQQDSPNLYWPITNLPTPIVDPHLALNFEGDLAYRMVPELLLAQTHAADEEYWNRALFEVLERWHFTDAAWYFSLDTPPRQVIGEQWERAVLSAYLISHVPTTRRSLVDQMGYDAAEVDKMPGSRVLLIYAGLKMEHFRDQNFSLFGLPYAEALARQKELDKQRMEDRTDPLNIVNLFLHPMAGQYLQALARSERNFALLRTVESLRDFVATHDRVPNSLDEVTQLAIPPDPISGQSFLYQPDKTNPRRCTLQTEGELAEYQVRIEITFRK